MRLEAKRAFSSQPAAVSLRRVSETSKNGFRRLKPCSPQSLATGQELTFEAWRSDRPNVAEVSQSSTLLLSGFRVYVNVAAGDYEVTVVQQGADYFTANPAGTVTLPH